MKFEEYRQYDALGLAKLVAGREVTAAELLAAATARSGQINPLLRAITIPMEGVARARAAGRLNGPFAGVPFLVKDMFQDYAGVLCSHGNSVLRRLNYCPPRHSTIVSRWLHAGLVVFGRTNSPELGLKGITEPELWGACRNPWNLQHSPGGSSGGAAAAVAAGIVPAAGANDGGGSIRIPAAYCGLFGLKPGRGRTPNGPDIADRMNGAVVNHVVSRTVRDSAAFLDATHGPEAASSYLLQAPKRSYLDEVTVPLERLRIAFSTVSPIGTPVDPAARLAIEDLASKLTKDGHEVVDLSPRIDGMSMAMDFLLMWSVHCAAHVDSLSALVGTRDLDLELDTRCLAAFGRATRADQYVAAHTRCQQYAQRMNLFLTEFDVYLTPTTAGPALGIGALDKAWPERMAMRAMLFTGTAGPLWKLGVAEQLAMDSLSATPFTQLANLCGLPAMSVPFGSSRGLPLGAHFTTRAGGEDLLFRLARHMEIAYPWDADLPAMRT